MVSHIAVSVTRVYSEIIQVIAGSFVLLLASSWVVFQNMLRCHCTHGSSSLALYASLSNLYIVPIFPHAFSVNGTRILPSGCTVLWQCGRGVFVSHPASLCVAHNAFSGEITNTPVPHCRILPSFHDEKLNMHICLKARELARCFHFKTWIMGEATVYLLYPCSYCLRINCVTIWYHHPE